MLAYVGTSSHGQGHETAFSMIASDVLGVPMEQVTVLQSDTAIIPQGGGTGGSRSLQIAGSAVKVASEEVLAQAKQLAAHLLEANPDDIVTGGGGLQVAGVPARTLSWADLATAVKDDARRPESLEAQLAHELTFDAGSSSFPFGAHIAVVEIDRDTGRVVLLRHIAVDDCGTIVNPLLVKGQQHGGLAQGAAQVLYEHVQYDEDGNPVTGQPHGLRDAARLPSSRRSRSTTRRLRARSTRSARRASANRRRSVRRRRCTTRSSTRSRTSVSATSTCRARPSGCGARSRTPTRSRINVTGFATPTLRLTESQYRVIVGHCYDGLPNEACGLLIGPVGRDDEPTGLITDARALQERGRVRA